jgi:hypothetical protein
MNMSLGHAVKKSVVRTSLLALATAFEMVSKGDPEFQREIADWEEGRTFSLGVLPDGPAITLRKAGGVIRYMGKGIRNPKLTIFFKNIDCAFMPLAGLMGAHTAFIQHRAVLHGNIAEAMQTNRALAMVQNYLLPGPVLKRITKRPPKWTTAKLLLKGKIMVLLTVGLLKNMDK